MIIDISYFNRVSDWTKVRGAVQAVLIRMGYRGYGTAGNITYDKKYKEYRAACEKYGIPFSLYFFPTSITDAEAEEEAAFIIKECTGMSFPLPVFLDSELAEGNGKGRADKLSREKRTHFLKLIIDKCQAAGIPMGVYASTSWLNNQLDMKQLPYSVWVAQYAKACTYKGQYMAWQYTSKAQVPGIIGGVDASVLHNVTVAKAVETKTAESIPTYQVGKNYTLQTELKVRKGPGTGYGVKTYSQLTSGGKKNDKDRDGALDKGTVVTCQEVKANGSDLWIRCPSGWLAAYYHGKIFIR